MIDNDMPVCVRLARERLSMFVNEEVPISARDLREMLSGVVLEYETLHAAALVQGRSQQAPELVDPADVKQGQRRYLSAHPGIVARTRGVLTEDQRGVLDGQRSMQRT